jgi:hypothetical protein
VTRYVSNSFPDVAHLNTFDVVIVSRSAPSGHYQSADSTAQWHSITVPTIHLGGYVLRGSRLGFTTGDTIPDTAGTIRLRVNAPSHPIFAGIALDGNTNMVNSYAQPVTYNGTVQRGISVNTSPVVSGATVLATVGTTGDPATGGMVIGEYPAGTVMGNASADITAGKRLVFLTGSREQGITSEGAGIFDLEGDGARLFLNAVRYMAGLEDPTPVTVSLGASVSPAGELVISWPEAGSQGFVLQAASALSPANWQPVAIEPVISGGQRRVNVPMSNSARFFRLRRP